MKQVNFTEELRELEERLKKTKLSYISSAYE